MKKKLVSLIIIVVLTFITHNCKILMHDYQNPCTKGEYYDSISCENWKNQFPNEFKNYKKRIENQN